MFICQKQPMTEICVVGFPRQTHISTPYPKLLPNFILDKKIIFFSEKKRDFFLIKPILDVYIFLKVLSSLNSYLE